MNAIMALSTVSAATISALCFRVDGFDRSGDADFFKLRLCHSIHQADKFFGFFFKFPDRPLFGRVHNFSPMSFGSPLAYPRSGPVGILRVDCQIAAVAESAVNLPNINQGCASKMYVLSLPLFRGSRATARPGRERVPALFTNERPIYEEIPLNLLAIWHFYQIYFLKKVKQRTIPLSSCPELCNISQAG